MTAQDGPGVRGHLMIVIHSLRGGGAERVAVDLAGYWLDLGCRVSVVTQTSDAQDAYRLPEGVRRHALALDSDSGGGLGGLWANARRWWALRRIMRREGPTVVLGMMTKASILAVMAGRGLPCRVIATEHTHPPAQRLPAVWQRLRRWAYPRADAVVALTRGTADWLDAQIPGVHAQVIPNAVRWPLPEGDPALDAGVPRGRRRLLAVGRLHPVKGFDLLVRAFASIADLFPDWDLVILGEGDQRPALQLQIDEAGLGARVSMPGRAGNIARWYEQSDLYVLSSRSEGLSNTLLEAMASGLPCVAFDCDTGPREVIRDGIDGMLVQPAGDPEALAAWLSNLMAHPELRERVARRAVDVLDRFSVSRVMQMWQQVFIDAARGRSSGH